MYKSRVSDPTLENEAEYGSIPQETGSGYDPLEKKPVSVPTL